LQDPFVPQLFAPWSEHSLSGSVSTFTAPHTPSAPAPFLAAEHAWQVVVHATSQHTPSTQKPLVHWPATAHAEPFGPGAASESCRARTRSAP
jgi:hypothetical protein